MKDIMTHMSELDQSDWDYYFSVHNDISNPFINRSSHEEFIKNYFHRGDKDRIFKKHFNVKLSLLNYSRHTNSTFFLGILIYYNTRLKNSIFLSKTDTDYSLFPFLWFLTCLFHDMGYDYEKLPNYRDEICDIDSLKKVLKIKYDFLKQPHEGVPRTITKNINKYFIWKRFVKNELDHGIVAGYQLYDKLIKNRITKYKLDSSKLFWSPELNTQYALAATVIASHNIWFSNIETEESYRTFSLDNLIGHKPICIDKSPLLFLLGIVDTIDPLKIFQDEFEPECILRNIKIEFEEDGIIIENGDFSPLSFEKLIKKCDDLKLWLSVDVKKNGNFIEIKFIRE